MDREVLGGALVLTGLAAGLHLGADIDRLPEHRPSRLAPGRSGSDDARG
jgi:hypothetical protein